MSGTRVKICGITQAEDAAHAAELGADAIGLNLFHGPRRIDPEQAHSIYYAWRPGTELGDDNHWICGGMDIVVLCGIDRREFPQSISCDEVRSLVHFEPDVYQVYGEYEKESAGSPALRNNWWIVLPIENRESIFNSAVKIGMLKALPMGILLDTSSPGKLGGTGKTFNWNWIAEAREAGELNGLPPIILAGGLTPENVAEAIRIVKPYAVDVSSGVEVPGKPGIKDPIKMRDFIQAAKSA